MNNIRGAYMSTTLLICKNTIKQLVTEALRSPVEKVFLGIGLQSGREFRVIEVQECPNISNNPQIHFTADPLCLYRLFSYAKERGLNIILFGHSHPTSPSPSPLDLENMRVWRGIWLIISSTTGGYAAWIFNEYGLENVEIKLDEC
jgi:proteasome lid subunit RPN8/RPN11